MVQAGVSPDRKLRVLIADDIQETRRNTRLMLSMIENVEVIAIASNGRQAVEMTREHRPDVVLLDVAMPEMNGLEAFSHIKQIKPNTGGIIISAQRESEILREAVSLGVHDYLFKPFTIDQLEEALEKASKHLVEQQDIMRDQQVKERNENYLKQLASEYVRTRRTDDQAVDVFEKLAANPTCELRWLRTLAMVYVIRQEWGKLKNLAVRLQQRQQNQG